MVHPHNFGPHSFDAAISAGVLAAAVQSPSDCRERVSSPPPPISSLAGALARSTTAMRVRYSSLRTHAPRAQLIESHQHPHANARTPSMHARTCSASLTHARSLARPARTFGTHTRANTQ
jgi:hypothetical protein